MKEEIRIDFFVENKQYAERYSQWVPNIGDEVRFRNIAYKVVYKIWIYDEKEDRVALNLKQIK